MSSRLQIYLNKFAIFLYSSSIKSYSYLNRSNSQLLVKSKALYSLTYWVVKKLWLLLDCIMPYLCYLLVSISIEASYLFNLSFYCLNFFDSCITDCYKSTLLASTVWPKPGLSCRLSRLRSLSSFNRVSRSLRYNLDAKSA